MRAEPPVLSVPLFVENNKHLRLDGLDQQIEHSLEG